MQAETRIEEGRAIPVVQGQKSKAKGAFAC